MTDPAALRAQAADLRKLCGEAPGRGDELAALSRIQDADGTDWRIAQANWEASIRAHGLGNDYGLRAMMLEGRAERIEAAAANVQPTIHPNHEEPPPCRPTSGLRPSTSVTSSTTTT